MRRFPGLNTERHGGSYVPRSNNNSTSTTSNQMQSRNSNIVLAYEHTKTAAGSSNGGNQGWESSPGSTAQTNNVNLRTNSHGGGYIPKRKA